MNRHNPAPMSDDVFDALAVRYLADDLHADDVDTFLQALANCSQRREGFTTLAWQMRLLRAYPWDESEVQFESLGDSTQHASDRGATFASDNSLLASRGIAGNGNAAPSKRLFEAAAAHPRSISPRSLILAVTAAAVVFYGCFLAISWNLRQMSRSSNPIARIVGEVDATWLSPRLEVGRELRVAEHSQSLSLAGGTVEIQLNQGAKLVIEGPAEWTIDDGNAVTLKLGKIVAQVPRQALGFTVQTSTATVIDLGTEFGVEVDASGRTDVEVFTGKVDVSYDPSAKSIRSRPTVRMSAGAAKRFSKQDGGAGVAVMDVAPQMKNWRVKKSSSIAINNPEQNLASRYAAMILADHPLAYWRLSDGLSEVAVDASRHGLDGRYCGALRPGQPGLVNGSDDRGVRVLGPPAPGWVEIDDVEVPASFTAEAWVRSSLPDWNAHSWVLGSREPYGFMMSPEYDGRTWRFLVGKSSGHPIAVGIHVPTKIDDRFHHYVGTYDALTDVGRMYFDGALVVESPYVLREGRIEKSPKLKLYLGRDHPDYGPKGCGEGWIDEVAIYPGVLSADQVRQHFETIANAVAAAKTSSD